MHRKAPIRSWFARFALCAAVTGCNASTHRAEQDRNVEQDRAAEQHPDAGQNRDAADSNSNSAGSAAAAASGGRAGSSADARSETEPDPDAAAHDSADQSPPASKDPCGDARAEAQDFLAAHRSCAGDSDCAIAGACSGGFGFEAVNHDAQADAQALSDATPAECVTYDGPMYQAVCDSGSCRAIETGGWCGEVPGPRGACGGDAARYATSCTLAESEDRAIESGCYLHCDDASAASCPDGFTCQAASVSGCLDGPGEGCSNCDPVSTHLCLPAPSCEVLLSLDFDGQPSASFDDDGELTLQFWAKNISDAEVTLSVPACASPIVQGLDGYDLFQLCVAGACAPQAPRRSFTLAAGESVEIAKTVLSQGDSACTAPLAAGTYAISFTLSDPQGAVVCGSAPAELSVF